MNSRRIGTLLVLGLSFLPSCGADDDVGIVVAEWSIDGRRDPFDCVRLGADLFEVFFLDRDQGAFAGEAEEPCEAFRLVLELDVGRYDVHARLITVEQESISETFFFEDVRVESRIGAVLHSDFIEQPLQ